AVLQEVVSTRDRELGQLVLRYRDYQRAIKRLAGIPILLEKLRKAQDFYVEMKWEFTSWVPLVSKICPMRPSTAHCALYHPRNKSGILGWRSEKTEMVNGYEAKVRGRGLSCLGGYAGSKTPLQSFLGIAEQHVGPNNGVSVPWVLGGGPKSHANPTAITPEEYFNPNFELGNRDMGRPMELTTKTQKFKAKLWLCEDHPLSLCEQVAPIIDLMAISNALFAKLRDFITLRLPPGFPVKI
ncbi:PREDICTED: ankyrin repeat domain-containing protein 13B-like, partial [Nestor notabilis]|uniref:ankyrin repeat domain-containing protein 13B-like n=1 Tax=Nestor notabilis TaxID=176057 RepID=UPI0005236CE7